MFVHTQLSFLEEGKELETNSPGVPKGATYETLTVHFNDISAVENLFETNKGEITAINLEPVVGNSGFIAPKPGSLMP